MAGKPRLPKQSSTHDPQETTWFFEGFRVTFRDLSAADGAESVRPHDMDTCWMVMCLNGDLRISVTGGEHCKEVSVPAGNCLLHYHPDNSSCTRCFQNQRSQLLELVCPAADLGKLVGDTPLGRDLQDAISSGRPMHMHRPMTASIHQALAALRETVTKAKVGAAPLLLAKALEMVWHFTQEAGPDLSSQLPPHTVQAIDKAKSILETRLESPPDLESLATEVGMSLSKFKQVFPLVCGMPPYSYLRLVRMERAMHLLRDQGRSVTEAALEVGYSNMSHFSKSFTEHYGIKPSQARHNKSTRPGGQTDT